MNITMRPVGYVKSSVTRRKDTSWGGETADIVMEEEFAAGLTGLEDFSHALIIYHLNEARYDREQHLQRRPQNREDMPLAGIFAQRGKDRPNAIGVTAVEIVAVADGALTVRGLDAIDGTPVLDVKPYYPAYDKREASVPEWVTRLMAHYF